MYRGLRRLLLCGTGSGSALTVVVSVTLWYGLACCNKCIESGFAHPSAKTPLEKHWQPSPILGGGGYTCLFFLEEQNWSCLLYTSDAADES